MKISIILKSLFAFALALSLASFTSDKKEKSEKTESTKPVAFDAALFRLNHTNKVKLAIDKGTDAHLRVVLKYKGGQTLYSELYSKDEKQYGRVFDLEGMNDGTYVFEILYKDQKLTKEVQIETNRERVISFQ